MPHDLVPPQRFITLDLAEGSQGQLFIRQIFFQGVPGWSDVLRLALNAANLAHKETVKALQAQAPAVQLVSELPKELHG